MPSQNPAQPEGYPELERAIDADDLSRVAALLHASEELRFYLLEDVPLMRTAQPGRIPMMELLTRYGADVNGLRWGWYPVLFTPCENLEPEPLQWLLDHGADPNRRNPKDLGTALDYLISSYVRDPVRLAACIDALLSAGGKTRYDLPGVLPILRGRTAELRAMLDADPALVRRRYPELDCGQSGGRMLTLRGGTLLHVAAEFACCDAALLLLDRGADVNARAGIDSHGLGGQTPLFHALTHFPCSAPDLGELFMWHGADLTIRARVPGHYERQGEVLEVSAGEYARSFPLR